MISAILSLLVLGIIGLYILAGICVFPMAIYNLITNPTDNPISEIIGPLSTSLLILVILSVIAYLISKNDYYYDYKSTVQKFLLISIPVFYVSMLLVSYIIKDTETINILLFKNEMDWFSRLLEIALAHSSCSCYPVLISSFVFKYFSEKEFVKESRARREIESEERKKKQQAERANQQIEYYKKLGDLEQLLKQETITKEKFNELKNSLDNQYNIK